ncbi:MAG: hypothetical protein DI586_08635 [Micavibrio aeruginosavorus]|uniref:Uncharacterized protein n=1 Tax=Micavibrio aeruginosavorus TaxID=349221 RepID=A0A2W5FFV2_9BACT|nr:MAG: hypothetical protein DI586_08635 [Micavibrio aeruginosavorus]
MDKAFSKAFLEEYKNNSKIYDANPKRLLKEKIYKRIIKDHPDWADKTSSLRRSGAKFNVAWAKTTYEAESNKS